MTVMILRLDPMQKKILMEKTLIPEPAPGWENHTGPWLPFVSQVSSRMITRGVGSAELG